MRMFVAAPKAAGNIQASFVIRTSSNSLVRCCARVAFGGLRICRGGARDLSSRGAAGTAIPFDDAGRTRGLDDAAKTPVAHFDEDRRAALDYLAKHPVAAGQLGAMGFCIGGHLAFRAALEPDVRATVCFYGTGIHDGKLGQDADAGSDQLEQQVSNLAATLAERDQRIIRLNNKLAEEKARFTVLAAADMFAPANGSVWEILTAPEEQVHRGQDVLRVLDCGEPVVTAVVGEVAYNRLQVGSPARFQPRDGQEDLPGRVIRLSAASALPTNLAVPRSAAMRESYHVTVAVPKLAEAQGCMVGRPGRVFFDGGPLESQVFPLPEADRPSRKSAAAPPMYSARRLRPDGIS